MLVGPSGCGKSTALRMLAGLEQIDAGAIYIGDARRHRRCRRSERDIAMVFQNYALYPHLTVAENIAFPLRIASVAEGRARSSACARSPQLLGLEPYLERKPAQLSGGQRQRVAMGRAIVRQPKVFLMDEPLSNLDAKLRVQMRAEIAALQRRLGTTTVYVTHDQVGGDDARRSRRSAAATASCSSATRRACSTTQPANVFVAGFIGSPAMNLFDVACSNGSVTLGGVSFPVPAGAHGDVVVGLRPESFDLASDGIAAEVEVVEEIGADSYVFAAADVGKLVARVETKLAPERGARIAFRPRAGEAHLFDPVTGARLSR